MPGPTIVEIIKVSVLIFSEHGNANVLLYRFAIPTHWLIIGSVNFVDTRGTKIIGI